MPIKETVNMGREFLDQFGDEGNGWRPLSHREEMEVSYENREKPPQELFIPPISNKAIKDLSEHLKPAQPDAIPGGPFRVLRPIKSSTYPRNQSYIWKGFDQSQEPVGVVGDYSTINTLHTWGYYGLFKPSMAEVLGRIKHDGRYVPNGEVEYYWTYGYPELEKALWPNVGVEVYANGQNLIIPSGAYHIGQTAIHKLFPDPEISRRLIEEYQTPGTAVAA